MAGASMGTLVAALVAHLEPLVLGRTAPLLVALDGRSGAGKSTLARAAAERLGASVIEGDDFYAGGSGESWDAMTAEQKVAHVIDWRHQRPMLEALRRGDTVTYHPYDWYDDANDGWAPHVVTVESAPVIILDGAYSARPELADLLDLRVLLLIDDDVRRAQLLAREGDLYRTEWEARWAEAELHYFGSIMPPEAFDLVLP
jgi:uridine kinase